MSRSDDAVSRNVRCRHRDSIKGVLFACLGEDLAMSHFKSLQSSRISTLYVYCARISIMYSIVHVLYSVNVKYGEVVAALVVVQVYVQVRGVYTV